MTKFSEDRVWAARRAKVLRSVDIFSSMEFAKFLAPGNRFEHSVRCPFHAGGRESRPSARIYPDSRRANGGRMYCFTCGKSWDPITFLKDFIGVGYGQALSQLESNFEVSRPTAEEIVNLDLDFYRPKRTLKGTELLQSDLDRVADGAIEQAKSKLSYVESRLRSKRCEYSVEKFRALGDVVDLLWDKCEKRDPTVSALVDKLLGKIRQ